MLLAILIISIVVLITVLLINLNQSTMENVYFVKITKIKDHLDYMENKIDDVEKKIDEVERKIVG